MAGSVALFLAVFGVYLYTMNPSVSVGDSGEFISSCHTLSLPHAPSYPLFSLLGKCSLTLFPMAHPAYRINLLSLLFGWGSAFLIYLFSLELSRSRAVAVIVAGCFAFSNVLWEHSLSVEVFTLNSFFSLLILVAYYRERGFNTLLKRTVQASFLLGLGLGNHHTLVFVALPIAVSWFLDLTASGQNGWQLITFTFKKLPLLFFFFLIGFSVYVYLPVRSLRNPPIDWSNPENLGNFIRVIRRADYGSFSLTLGNKMERNLPNALRQIERYLRRSAHDFTPLGVFLAFCGWFVWFKGNRATAIPLFIYFVASGVGFLILGNLPLDAQSEGVLPRFYIAPAIAQCLAVGMLFSWLSQRVGQTAFWCAAGLPLFLLTLHPGYQRYSREDFVAYDYGRNLLRSLPAKAVLFMDGGDDTFYTLAYFSMVESRRLDLELHDRGGLIYRNPYGPDFRQISKEAKALRRKAVESSFLGLRPLYYATFDLSALPETKLAQRGLLYEAVPKNQVQLERSLDLSPFYALRGIFSHYPQMPYRVRALIPVYTFMRLLNPQTALTDFIYAAHYGTDIVWLVTNLEWEMSKRAYALVGSENLSLAEQWYQEVLKLNPKSDSSYANLGVLAEKRNENSLAESYYLQAVSLNPQSTEAYYNLGVLYWKQERWADVVSAFEQTLRIDSRHEGAQKYLAVAQRKMVEGGAH